LSADPTSYSELRRASAASVPGAVDVPEVIIGNEGSEGSRIAELVAVERDVRHGSHYNSAQINLPAISRARHDSVTHVSSGPIVRGANMKPAMPGTILLAFLIEISGCASTDAVTGTVPVGTLEFSGFQARKADTPEKSANLREMPQHQFVRHDRNGKIVYTYADATGCGCLYVGDQAAYDSLEGAEQAVRGMDSGNNQWELWE
jgi:hypothetical protein